MLPIRIHRIAQFFDAVYDTVHTRFEREKPLSSAASPPSGNASTTLSMAPPGSTKPATSAPDSKARRRRGRDRPAAASVIVADHAGGSTR